MFASACAASGDVPRGPLDDRAAGSCPAMAARETRREVLGDADVGQGEPGRAGRRDDRGRTGERLDAALAAAPALRAVDVDADVPDLAGVAARAAVHVPVHHDARPDAGAHVERGEARAGLALSAPVLPDGGRGRVVLEHHRQAGGGLQGVGEREVGPRLHDRRRQRHAGGPRQRAGGDDAEADDPVRVDTHLRDERGAARRPIRSTTAPGASAPAPGRRQRPTMAPPRLAST